jgi:LysM repeat protein
MAAANSSSENTTVAKAKIVEVDETGNAIGDPIICMYNPEQLKVNRGANWSPESIPQRTLQKYTYKGGAAATVDATLLFDTTRDMNEHGVKVSAGTDVRTYVNKLYKLLKVVDEEKKRPPYCRFEWGGKLYFVKGFLKSVNATYTLFLADGTPVRAEVGVSFEIADEEADLDKVAQNPTSRTEARKTWIVREGERLDWIANQEYGHPGHWRHIAEVNGIEDPLDLQPGQVLKLPPLA